MVRHLRAAYWAERLKSAFWVTPSLTALAVLALLPASLLLEARAGRFAFLEAQTLEGTRLVLSSIAAAVMTVVGVLFSLTVVVLQQVAQQYTPRVIENFIRSMPSQIVLGLYVGTFAYALILLRTLGHGAGEASQESPPPTLPPTLAIALALACLAALIYYIHHLAKAIKSTTILAGMSRETIAAMEDLRRSTAQGDAAAAEARESYAGTVTVRAAASGYLQAIDWRGMESDLGGLRWQAALEASAGDYVHQGAALMTLESAPAPQPPLTDAVLRRFSLGPERTHSQDIRFGLRQMADIALRALSPGVNDPSTAEEALNEIGTVLLHYTRHCPEHQRAELAGGCVTLKEPSYRDLLELSFDEIAAAAKPFPRLTRRIGEILCHCEAHADTARAAALRLKREHLRPGSQS